MLVLGLETSAEAGSVGVLNEERSLSQITFEATLKHGEKLLPAIESALELAAVPKKVLDLIAVATGPGSFTGLRIGIATALGLGEALGIPVHGIPSASVYERESRFWSGTRWVILPDRQNWVYATAYQGIAPMHELAVFDLEDFAELIREDRESMLLIGPGAERHRARLEEISHVAIAANSLNMPSGIGIARLGLEKFDPAVQNRAEEIEPLYLQPPLASANNKI